jgi:hypothetical protein
MLQHFYDRHTIRASLSLQRDPELHDLLAARIVHLEAEGLLDMTEIVLIDSDTTEMELIAAIGFTPLIDADGHRFGETDYCPTLDYVSRVSANYHEAIHCVGMSGFCFQLLIHEDADARLVALCRELAK